MDGIVSILLTVMFLFVNARHLTEIFIVEHHKKFLISDDSSILNMSSKSKIECAVECQHYGEECCGGYFVKSTSVCVIGISGCCHAELLALHGYFAFHRKSKRRSVGKFSNKLSLINSKNL